MHALRRAAAQRASSSSVTAAMRLPRPLVAGPSSTSSSGLLDVPPPPRLLIVYHSRTGLAAQMSEAMEEGARAAAREMDEPLELTRLRASEASADDLLASDGYLFCCPENLASASGEMLEFFHRTYYAAFDDETGESSTLAGRPYGLAVAAGSDGTGAAGQIERICRGWRLRPVGEAFVNRNGLPQDKAAILAPKVCQPQARGRCAELGGLVAATLLL
ncbi:hypothetical protein ACHAWF_012327 [Thalassiosira exigua]